MFPLNAYKPGGSSLAPHSEGNLDILSSKPLLSKHQLVKNGMKKTHEFCCALPLQNMMVTLMQQKLKLRPYLRDA